MITKFKKKIYIYIYILKLKSDSFSLSLSLFFSISKSHYLSHESQLSFSLLIQILKFWIVCLWTKDSFSEISFLFLLKINNTVVPFLFLFLVLFSLKKINKKGNYFATLCLVAKKIKENNWKNQKEKPQKKTHLLHILFRSRENQKKKKKLLKKTSNFLLHKEIRENPFTPAKVLTPPQNFHQPPSKHQNCRYPCQPNPNSVSPPQDLHTKIERWERKWIHHPSSIGFRQPKAKKIEREREC